MNPQTVTPVWIDNNTKSGGALAAISTKVVSSRKRGLICGFWLFTEKPDYFYLSWRHNNRTHTRVIAVNGSGTIYEEFNVPINQGLEADSGSTITLAPTLSVNTTSNGALLIAEVDD